MLSDERHEDLFLLQQFLCREKCLLRQATNWTLISAPSGWILFPNWNAFCFNVHSLVLHPFYKNFNSLMFAKQVQGVVSNIGSVLDRSSLQVLAMKWLRPRIAVIPFFQSSKPLQHRNFASLFMELLEIQELLTRTMLMRMSTMPEWHSNSNLYVEVDDWLKWKSNSGRKESS